MAKVIGFFYPGRTTGLGFRLLILATGLGPCMVFGSELKETCLLCLLTSKLKN